MAITHSTKVSTPNSDLLTQLRQLVETNIKRFADPIHCKRMFGCDAFFRGEQIFALIWKEGRIGIRLPNQVAFDMLSQHKGAEPWRAGTRTMSHWLLVPVLFHEKQESLNAWLLKAYELAAVVHRKVKLDTQLS